MADLVQLNSFVEKFVSLWNAKLQVTTCTGEAQVTLVVGLRRPPEQTPPSPHQGRYVGPARICHINKRAEERK